MCRHDRKHGADPILRTESHNDPKSLAKRKKEGNSVPTRKESAIISQVCVANLPPSLPQRNTLAFAILTARETGATQTFVASLGYIMLNYH